MRSSVVIAVLSIALAVAAAFAVWEAAGAPWQSSPSPVQATPAAQPVLETQLEKCQRTQIAYETLTALLKDSNQPPPAALTAAVAKLGTSVLTTCAPEVPLNP